MSRRTTRRHQQAMNEWRRTGRMFWLASMGIPVQIGPGAWYIPPDPAKEREEFVRQLTARVPLEPGQPEPMRAEVGEFQGFRFITSGAPID